MPRVTTAEKFDTIIDGAGRVFARVGYRRAMMSDIADEAGVALGTLYRYAETKEELFELALRQGLGEPPTWLPLEGLAAFGASVLELTRTRFRFEDVLPSLAAAVDRDPPADATNELTEIARELYDVVDRYHMAIRMLDRSTAHWPELERVFASELRAPSVRALTRYLRQRCDAGALRTPPDVGAAARLVVELVATHAMHRRYSPGGAWTDDATARRATLDAITTMFSHGDSQAGRPSPASVG